MRFFEQKKTLKPDDLSVLKSVEALLAEWTGLEPSLVLSLFSIIYKFRFVRTPEVVTNNLMSFDS